MSNYLIMNLLLQLTN